MAIEYNKKEKLIYFMNIQEIQQSLLEGCIIEYSAHCQKRMLERNISRGDIVNCIVNGEIIEEYPLSEDNYSENSFPSCLVLGEKMDCDEKIHIVIGYNGEKILIISACYPDVQYWLEDYKTRRSRHV